VTVMRLKFEPFAGRRSATRSVVDEDTGNTVGHIRSNGVGFSGGWGNRRYGGIEIDLFGGRYQETFNTYDQCLGFVKAVEAVLGHMSSLRDIVARDNV
jgi:hypothetical protein